MLMRYHFGLGVGHSYAHSASSGSDQQSADRSHEISTDEHEDQDEEHGGSITIPQYSNSNELCSESAEEDSSAKPDSDYSLDFGNDDYDSWEDDSEESDILEEMYCY
jgi:hypothetical protein